MTIIVRIILVGLMVVHPGVDEGKVQPGEAKAGKKDGSLDILLRDSRFPFYAAADGHCADAHIPVLAWFNTACSPSGTCQSGGTVHYHRCDGSQQAYGPNKPYWLLDRQEITLSPEPATGSVKKLPDYLGDVKHVSGGGVAKLNDYWVKDKGQGSGAVARLTIRPAKLEVCHLVSDESGKQLEFSGVRKKYLADVAVATYEVRSADGTLELSATSFDGSQMKKVTLTPKPCSDDSSKRCLTLVLSNQPPDKDGSRVPTVAHHFERYYHFAEQEPKIKDKRIPAYERTSTLDIECDLLDDTANDVLAAVIDGTTPAFVARQPRARAFFDEIVIRGLNNRPICPIGGY